jgi:hypothetical protein
VVRTASPSIREIGQKRSSVEREIASGPHRAPHTEPVRAVRQRVSRLQTLFLLI